MADDKLFNELVAAARMLVTTCTLAADTLSEEFQDMITVPADNLKAVLAKCPAHSAMPLTAGQALVDDDIVEEIYKSETARIHGHPATAVKLRHIPTGLATECYTYNDVDRNREAARRSLRALLSREMGIPPQS